MCGIVGMLGVHNKGTFDIFNQLLIVDQIRGHHSTGMAAAYVGGFVRVVKRVGPANYLLYDKVYNNKVVNGRRDPVLLMGHNRFATQGTINEANAHPFTHGHITLAHNGTLNKGWEHLFDTTFETDSETICNLIKEEGIDAAYARLDGAAALSWWDNQKRTINLIQNGKRPLHIARTADGKQVWWASESFMLTGVLGREGVKLDEGDVWEVKPHWLCTFKLEGQAIKADYRELRPFVWKSSTYYSVGKSVGGVAVDENPYEAGWEQVYGKENKVDQKPTIFLPKPDTAAAPVITGRWNKVLKTKKAGDHLLTREEFALRYDHCCFCNADVDPNLDFDGGALVNEQQVICHDCVDTIEKEGLAWVL